MEVEYEYDFLPEVLSRESSSLLQFKRVLSGGFIPKPLRSIALPRESWPFLIERRAFAVERAAYEKS
jgi:hypothetical protein